MEQLEVQVAFTVVPDGVRIDKSKGRTFVRLSVGVSPYLGDPASSHKIEDLRRWPTLVSALTKSMRVSIAELDESTATPRVHDVRTLPSAVPSDANGAFTKDAQALWLRIFDCLGPPEDGIAALFQAIKDKSVGQKPKEKGAALRFGGYQVAELERVSDSLYGAALAATLQVKIQSILGRRVGEGMTSESPVTDDMSYPSVGWWQDFTINALGAAPSPLTQPKSDSRAVEIAAAARRIVQGTSQAVKKDLANYQDAISGMSNRLYAAASAMEAKSKDPKFWLAPRGGLKATTDPSYAAIAAELKRFAEAWGLDGTPLKSKPRDVPLSELAGRAYSAILSYPTIAKYLGLIIDLEVELGEFLGGQDGTSIRGAVAVEPVGSGQPSPSDQLQWTAYTGHFKGPLYFGPATAPATSPRAGSLPIRDGLLDLSAQWSGQPRFALVTLDTASHYKEFTSRGQNVLSASLRGLVEQKISAKLPNRRTRGINLVDRARDPQSLLDEATKQERARRRATAPNTLDVRYAEDLVRGVQIDGALLARSTPVKPGMRPDKHRWRTLFARNVAYPDTNVAPDFLKQVAPFADRDDGHSRQMTGTSYVTQPDGKVLTQKSAHPELISWSGESLAVPGNGLLATGPSSGEADNPFNVTIDVPTQSKEPDSDRSPLPLRETRAYVFGGRMYYVNGCGLNLADAIARYTDTDSDLVLGDPSGSPFVYQRRQEIAAPEVCLIWNDRMVTEDLARLPGESIETLVVRSGDSTTRTARRFLVPPRTSFDLAEQFGLFDSSNETHPAGAFVRGTPAQLSQKTGGLPLAVGGGKWADADDPNNAKRTSRGMVLVLDQDAPSPSIQYYPDPMASAVCARFVNGSGVAVGSTCLQTPRKFWGAGQSAVDTLPIVLELKHLSTGVPSGAFQFDTPDDSEGVSPMNTGNKVYCEKLAVAIGAAETVDLELWSYIDAPQCVAHHQALRKALGLFPPDLGNLEWVQRALNQNPIGQLANHHVVKLVHAVDRPLAVPAFVPDKERRDWRIHPVVLTVAKDDGPPSPIHTWKRYVQDQEAGPTPVDRMAWKSEAGGTKTFFVGEALVHRPSTGRLRCEAEWHEYGPENLRLKANRKEWDYIAPKSLAQLFSLETGEVTPSNRDLAIDLVWPDSAGDPRGLSFTFPNMRARHLTLRLTATSRFTAFFPSETQAEKMSRERTGKGRYEEASVELVESKYKVWVPCTFRPPVVQVDRIMPLFNFRETRTHDEITWVREAKLRVHVDSWYATGEDELLGIACWPPTLLNPDASAEAQADSDISRTVDLCDFCALDTAGYGTLVTRWGADPIHQSAPLEPVITADRFTGYVAKAGGIFLSMAAPPDPTIPVVPPLAVSVVGYAPHLDKVEGRFYFDVGLDPGAAYYPFVQLGLTRYQPHSVERFELSYSSPTTVQIPPRREGRVLFLPHGKILLELHGIGFHRSETGPDHDKDRPFTDVPLLNVRVLRVSGNGSGEPPDAPLGWVPALDEEGMPIEFLRLQPIRKGAEVWWIKEIQVPSTLFYRYALQVEEVELLAAGSLNKGAESTCSPPRFGTTLEERGPMFMHLIDLRR